MRSTYLRHLALPLAIALTVPTVVATYPTAAWAQAKKQTIREQLPLEARGHWDAGIALVNNGKWAQARTSFAAAYDMSKNPRVLFNVAVCEKNIAQYHRAWATIQSQLAEKSKLPADEIADAQQFAAGLEKFIAHITIDIDQKDAEIYVNDDKIDNAKLPGPIDTSGGPIKVRAVKPGFAEATETKEVAGGRQDTFTIKMQALERTTIVNVNVIGPPRATVKVDNQEVGQTPYSGPVRVSETPHQISVEAPGYVTGVQPLVVKEGPPINLTMTLAPEQAKGKLVVVTKPPGATIEIDGKQVGATRWEGPVDARVHQVTVKKPGYYTWSYEADVPRGGERSLSASLNEDRNTSFVPWLIGTIVVGGALIVGIVLLATPPDQKPINGTLDPFTVRTNSRPGGGFPGFQF
ncbi:MAG: PEGA domain-containing protein [Labilithrix sp.]|nr:PEGA domain-containing protein [Labilithrix sp.]MCW5810664.1 PEGA domain-containing protein [Labilithrix sp.]